MAVVNGLTAERMQEVIDETITSASVVGTTLSLIKEGGGVVEVNLVNVLAKVTADISESYTLIESDAGKLFSASGSGTIITIPNSSVPIPIGSEIDFIQWGPDSIVLADSDDSSIVSRIGLYSNGQYSRFKLEKLGSTSWIASGDLTD